MPEDVIQTDMVIIGAGPCGLFAVFEAGLLGMKCHLVDNLDKIGGQCAELYPDKPIYDIPAVPRCTGQELVDQLMEQIRPFEPRLPPQAAGVGLERLPDGRWRLETDARHRDRGAGGRDRRRCRQLRAAPPAAAGCGARSRAPRCSTPCARWSSSAAGTILVAGGGDSALDWVLNLEPIAASMALVHRRDEFRAAPDSVEKMRHLVAEGRMRAGDRPDRGLEGEGDRLAGRAPSRAPTAAERPFHCDTLLAFYGLKMELGPIAGWGLNLDGNLIAVETAAFETSRPGIFAIGDICTYPGKLKLILSGFHEAALMCQKAFKICFPEQKLIFRYTTSSTDLQKKLGVA